jgi:Flp pilus assembly protein TadD
MAYPTPSSCSVWHVTKRPPTIQRALSARYQPVKLADTLLKIGRVDESRRLLGALGAEPLTRPFAEYGLGQIAAAEGRHDAAIAHLQRAIALFPEWGEAHYALAISYRRLGRQEDAERAMAAACSLARWCWD